MARLRITDFSMTVDGYLVNGPGTFPVIDPSTGRPFADAPDCDDSTLHEAVASATTAQNWGTDEERLVALRGCADVIRRGRQTLGSVLAQEQGKPLAAAIFEVDEAARWLEAASALTIPEEHLHTVTRRALVTRRPLGVTAAITPWNFPLLLAAHKLGPALRAGNTIVLKPSPYTPLSTLLVGQLLSAVLPAGVLNVVSGRDPLGSRLTEHPDVRKISFTGSVATGKAVAGVAAAGLKRTTLELGGNDAAIVLDDADVNAIAKRLFWAAFTNNGQVCAGVKRVLVHRSRHDDLVNALAVLADAARVGAWNEPRVQLGPLNNKAQLDRVESLVRDANGRGAVSVAGGSRIDREGYFFAPTVLARTREGMPIVDEEQFGPVLPIMSYDTDDEAVTRANATQYGLSGSVWGSDLDRVRDVAGRLECGVAFANTHLSLDPDVPFGGVKSSGIGVENGAWGLEEFSSVHVQYELA